MAEKFNHKTTSVDNLPGKTEGTKWRSDCCGARLRQESPTSERYVCYQCGRVCEETETK